MTQRHAIRPHARRIARAALILTLLLVAACAGSQVRDDAISCRPPQTRLIDEAIRQAKSDLQVYECQYAFDSYFDRLLDIAEGSPSKENRKRFSNFLVWCGDQGIITQVQTKAYYNRYFNTTFISLNDDYSTCHYCPDIDAVEKEMAAELVDKERGLMRICDDKAAYTTASSQFGQLLMVLDATCMSCEAD